MQRNKTPSTGRDVYGGLNNANIFHHVVLKSKPAQIFCKCKTVKIGQHMNSTMYWHKVLKLRAVTQETVARKYQICIRANDFLPFARDEVQKMTKNNCRQPGDTILSQRNPHGALEIKSPADNSEKVTRVSSKRKNYNKERGKTVVFEDSLLAKIPIIPQVDGQKVAVILPCPMIRLPPISAASPRNEETDVPLYPRGRCSWPTTPQNRWDKPLWILKRLVRC